MDTIRHIAIVGAGFSGTALAIRLLQLCTEPVRISLLDQHHSFGPGIAYSCRWQNESVCRTTSAFCRLAATTT
jgi:uncharacterized NAD(P)/FAD-binding protein YdhS